MAVENQPQPRPSLGIWFFYAVLLILAVCAFAVARPQLGALIAPLFGYTTEPLPATRPTALVPQPVQQQPIIIPIEPSLAEPLVNPTDIAAAREAQPDDYQEQTKPNRRILPTLEPEIHTNIEHAAPASQEGTKPAKHRLP